MLYVNKFGKTVLENSNCIFLAKKKKMFVHIYVTRSIFNRFEIKSSWLFFHIFQVRLVFSKTTYFVQCFYLLNHTYTDSCGYHKKKRVCLKISPYYEIIFSQSVLTFANRYEHGLTYDNYYSCELCICKRRLNQTGNIVLAKRYSEQFALANVFEETIFSILSYVIRYITWSL